MTVDELEAHRRLYEKVDMLKEKGYYPHMTHGQLLRLLERLEKENNQG